MTTVRKILVSLIVIGAVGAVAGVGVFSAFSDTTTNSGDQFSAGTVTLTDNDLDAPAYNVSNGKPGDFQEMCIKVTYDGSLPATVKLYRSGFSGGTGLDAYIDLAITKGTDDQTNCGDFNPGSSIYSSTLSGLATTWAGGIALTDQTGSAVWDDNDAVTYRIRATLQNDNAAQGKTAGTHNFVWEAQNN